eukprot:scaffold488_cov372-Prasinococcus_capsulatus_cf.AAC.7
MESALTSARAGRSARRLPLQACRHTRGAPSSRCSCRSQAVPSAAVCVRPRRGHAISAPQRDPRACHAVPSSAAHRPRAGAASPGCDDDACAADGGSA